MDTTTARKTVSGGRGLPTTCRYDAYRRRLLDSLRARWQGPHVDNASLVVMDALDRLLVAEGLLPPDAPLYSSVQAARARLRREGMTDEDLDRAAMADDSVVAIGDWAPR